MSGLVQQGAVNAVGSGVNNPTITGVTAGNTLICFYQCNVSFTSVAPTDSAGQTWTLLTSANANTMTTSIAYLLNANAGTHTLTFATQSSASEANIIEVNGITATGGTPATAKTSTGATTATTNSYTPSQANEFVVALMGQTGNNANDHNACTTAGFQTIGTTTDFGGVGKNCVGIEQNGSSFGTYEANAQIVTTTSALTATWTWTTNAANIALLAGFKFTPGGAAAPVIPVPDVKTPSVSGIGFAGLLPNLLLTTLAAAPLALPPGQQVYASAPAVKAAVQCDQYLHPLTLGISAPSVLGLPLNAQTWDMSAPAVKAPVQADQYFHPLTLGIASPPALLPLESMTWDASAPAVKYQPQVDIPANILPLGYPVLIPAWAFFGSAPAVPARLSVDVSVNLLPLGGAPISLLPLESATWDASAPQPKWNVTTDVFPNIALELTPIPLLPLEAATWDASAPQAKYSVSVDVFSNLLPLQSPIPLLPLEAGTWDVSAPQVKSAVQVDVVENRLVLQPIITTLPAGAREFESSPPRRWDNCADQFINTLVVGYPTLEPAWIDFDEVPQLRGAVYVQQAVNRLVLLPVPGVPTGARLDSSAPAIKFAVQVDRYPPSLALQAPLVPLPPGARLDASAPAVKFAVQVDRFPSLILQSSIAGPLSGQTMASSVGFGPMFAASIGTLSGQTVSLAVGYGALGATVALAGLTVSQSISIGALVNGAFQITGMTFSSSLARGVLSATAGLLGSTLSTSTGVGTLSAQALISGIAISTSFGQAAILGQPLLSGAPHYLIVAPYQQRLITTNVQRFPMQTGPLPYAEYFMRVGEKNTFGIDWANWLANRWIQGALVTAGFVIRPTVPNGYQMICTAAGESGAAEPTWPTTIGATLTEGSVTWTCEAFDTTSLEETVTSATWIAQTGVVVQASALVGQIASVFLDVSGATAGTDYLVNCNASLTDGEVKIGQLKLKVS